MSTNGFLFWTLAFSGAIVCGWWLAVRPSSPVRDLATPVSVLVVVMGVLLGMLALSGQDLGGFTMEMYDTLVH